MRINLYADGEYDLINEAYYTAALRQIVGPQVLNCRARIDVHRIKSMYVIYYGENPHDDVC